MDVDVSYNYILDLIFLKYSSFVKVFGINFYVVIQHLTQVHSL